MTLSNAPTWIDGVIGGNGNLGVYLPAFEAGKKQAAGFDLPIPHNWMQGTDWDMHIHIVSNVEIAKGKKLKFLVEYSFSQPDSVFPVTQVFTKKYVAPAAIPAYTHKIIDIGDIDTSGVTSVSPHVACTFVRDGISSDDDFAGDVFLVNLGVHYRIDMLGSKEEYVKY